MTNEKPPQWHGEKPFVDLSESRATLRVPKPERIYDLALFATNGRPLLLVHAIEEQFGWVDGVRADVEMWPSGKLRFGPLYQQIKIWADVAEVFKSMAAQVGQAVADRARELQELENRHAEILRKISEKS